MPLHIAIAQINPTVGDLPGNARLIVEAARAAHAQGARLLLTPELAVCGYPADDLLLQPGFVAACQASVAHIAQETAALADLTLVVGHPTPVAGPREAGRALCHNAASVLRGGRIVATALKQNLPDDAVFDERRHFVPGPPSACVFEAGEGAQSLRVGLLICEDAWQAAPAAQARAAGAQLLAVINASPWRAGKPDERQQAMRQRVLETGLPLVYANLTGGQDELVFDGASFALQADGALAGRAACFEPQLWPVQAAWQGGHLALAADSPESPESPEGQLWAALVLALRDYARKNGFGQALLGLSGGIDSALVLALAVDALGASQVRTVMMPSPYTASISLQDAREMARRVGVRHDEIDIAPAFETLQASLAPLLEGKPADTTEENLQARVRGVLLMALSNKHGHLLLTTGNKSEYAVGYCTLYGDMCGGFAPIKDVYKTAVFALARWRNAHNPCGTVDNPIPERIITRPPSAELREGQTDQDSLPPYEVLDAMLARVLEQGDGRAELEAAGFDPAQTAQVLRLLRLAEYKRRQSAPGPCVSQRGFGSKDWRYPVTNGLR